MRRAQPSQWTSQPSALTAAGSVAAPDRHRGCGLNVGRLVGCGQQHRAGLRRHRPSAVGGGVSGRQLRVGVGDRGRDRGWRIAGGVGDIGLAGLVGFRGHLAGLAMRVPFPVPRTLFDGFIGRCAVRFQNRGRAVCAGCHCRRRPCQTHEQSRRQYQRRAPAGFDHHVAISPFARPRKRNETPLRVHSGAKKGNLRVGPGESRATAPNRRAIPAAFSVGLFPGFSLDFPWAFRGPIRADFRRGGRGCEAAQSML